ncbi:MAG: hypothetical protein HY535_02895 [Chloroflexi bacterium]|nr:hypothetical protein [Chloroflexota bacterium]
MRSLPFISALLLALLFAFACRREAPSTPSPSAPRASPTSAPPLVATPSPLSTPTTPPVAGLDGARRTYPPDVTGRLLRGELPPPQGFDACAAETIGLQRLDALRSSPGTPPSGRENDAAALCLLRLGQPPQSMAASVHLVPSTYKVATGATSGFFKTGQDADIMLSGFGFNDTGGPLLFNHPSGIATDGTRLFLADTFNNRVLVWNTLPKGNVAPDLVLGQKDFRSNNPGTGRDQLDWPISVATDGTRLVVADTNNYRILIWDTLPTRNGQPADLVLQGGGYDGGPGPSKSVFWWPWGVWTNGEKVVITSTQGGAVLIWNQFPTKDNQPADILLRGGGKLGTPRHVTSDGNSLIVGDHNARVEGQPPTGAFFWKTFPTADDQPFDFYKGTGPWLRGTFAPDGKLIIMGATLFIWNTFPQDEKDAPDLTLAPALCFGPGDYESVAVAGNSLYVSCGNGNKVVVYRSIPTRPDQPPDFAIGSPDLKTSTLETNFIVQNGVPASNGKSLFVSSDFDRKLYVWKHLPDESGAHPDIVYSFDFGPMDNALLGDTFALAGGQTVLVWNEPPTSGKSPDLVFKDRIGSVQFQQLAGVAMDGTYFYLGDNGAGKVYVWKGVPGPDSEPALVLAVPAASRLSSDGKYLAVATVFEHKALIYPVEGLTAATKPVVIGGPGKFNGVPDVAVSHGHLFLVDGGFNRVFIWRNVQDALAGKEADVILGANQHKYRPELGRNTFFLPYAFSFDGAYLWVAEVKFSNRILRFSPSP